jgi:hypothetical protein
MAGEVLCVLVGKQTSKMSLNIAGSHSPVRIELVLIILSSYYGSLSQAFFKLLNYLFISPAFQRAH